MIGVQAIMAQTQNDAQCLKDCGYCNGIYSGSTPILNENNIYQQYYKPYTYETEDYVCVPWSVKNCEDASILNGTKTAAWIRVQTNFYQKVDNKTQPFQITYNKYTSKAEDYGDDMNLYMHEILIRYQLKNPKNTLALDKWGYDILTNKQLLLPNQLGPQIMKKQVVTDNVTIPMTLKSNYLLAASNLESLKLTAKCVSQRICAQQSLIYLLQRNLCLAKTLVFCHLSYPKTGKEMLELVTSKILSATQDMLYLYNQYLDIAIFRDPFCQYDETSQVNIDKHGINLDPVNLTELTTVKPPITVRTHSWDRKPCCGENRTYLYRTKPIKNINPSDHGYDVTESSSRSKSNIAGLILGSILLLASIVGCMIYKIYTWRPNQSIRQTYNTLPITEVHSLSTLPN